MGNCLFFLLLLLSLTSLNCLYFLGHVGGIIACQTARMSDDGTL